MIHYVAEQTDEAACARVMLLPKFWNTVVGEAGVVIS